jgi:hypothetical protein
MTEQRKFARGFVLVGGALLVLVASVCAVTGAVSPMADPSDFFASALTLLPQPATNLVVAVIGAVTAATALVSSGRAAVPLRTASIVGLLVLLGPGVLAAVGYLPFLLVSALAGDPDPLRKYLSVALVLQLVVVALVVTMLWTWIEQAVRGGGAVSPGRGRLWTWIAIGVPLAYAVSRVLMAIGFPGLSMENSSAAGGLGLAAAAVGGAVLTWGLIRPWGERFPRWMVGLAGRPVPVRMAVLPALFVAVLVMAGSRLLVLQVLADNPGIPNHPLVWLPIVLWPLWSVALAAAAMHYRFRRARSAVEVVR